MLISKDLAFRFSRVKVMGLGHGHFLQSRMGTFFFISEEIGHPRSILMHENQQ